MNAYQYTHSPCAEVNQFNRPIKPWYIQAQLRRKYFRLRPVYQLLELTTPYIFPFISILYLVGKERGSSPCLSSKYLISLSLLSRVLLSTYFLSILELDYNRWFHWCVVSTHWECSCNTIKVCCFCKAFVIAWGSVDPAFFDNFH